MNLRNYPRRNQIKDGDGGSGGTPNSNGASGNPNENPNANSGNSSKVINPEDHQRAIDDMHRFKREAKAANEKLTALETTVNELKAGKLKESGDFKTLYENEKASKEAALSERDTIKAGVIEGKKREKVRELALKAGINNVDYIDLFQKLDGVEVELTTHGNAIVHGADTFIENLKKKNADWFTPLKAANINTGGTGNPIVPKEITAAYMATPEVLKMKKENPTAYKSLEMAYIKQAAVRAGAR